MSTHVPNKHLRPARLLAGVGVGALLVVAGGSAAQAHVTVKPESTAGGGFSQLVFRAPTESDTASTVKLKVDLPTDTPLLYVSTLPMPGWTAKVTTSKLAEPVESYGSTITEAPSSVTWTADGDRTSADTGIAPGEYQNFAISAGPLPAEGTMVFPATQSYSDGEVVAWATVPVEGEDEPDKPAPTFVVTPAEGDGHGGTGTTTAGSDTTSTSEDGGSSTVLAGIALGVAVLALLIAGVGALRGRSGSRIEA
jgi:uncharacterized protein YcnI